MAAQQAVVSHLPTTSVTPKTVQYRLGRFVLYIILIGLSILFLIPVYMVLVTSFKSLDQVSISTMWDFPSRFTWESIRKAADQLAPSFFNSVVLVLPATIISAIAGSLNGYVFAKWRFRGANLLFTLILFGMFIPYQAVLIPLVKFLQWADLYGSLNGLILTHIVYGLPITTLIFRNYYAKIPTELVEAGLLDGGGFFSLYLYVILPLSVPAFVVVIIWQFTQIWNEFLFGVTITSVDSRPMTVALQNLSGSQIVEWNVQMAGAFLTALPTLLVYIILGRYFIRGLLAGSVKG
ncbi:MAG: carbohydrate ABC transporter permease [Anaerolineae bacterium]|nr:carbohydrate ABC transporter permease [Anaerolineae bacterium]